jgi:hypothetical protein
VTWSFSRGNIDHVVVAPAGVFVVDAKRYERLIEIRCEPGSSAISLVPGPQGWVAAGRV